MKRRTVLVTCARRSTVWSAVTVPFARILTGTSRASARAVTTVMAPPGLRAACASCFFAASDHHHAMHGVDATGRARYSALSAKYRAHRQRICIPEMAREMTRRWISDVPSKIVVSRASRQWRWTAYSVV